MSGVALIDYGIGNLKSLRNAFEYLGADVMIVKDPDQVAGQDRLVLPGVGAASHAMAELNSTGLGDALTEFTRTGKQVIGVCLGMQLLANFSDEDNGQECLGLIPGTVRRLESARNRPVPHIGWNELELDQQNPLVSDLPEESHAYFVHSYFFDCKDQAHSLARTEYGILFSSMVTRDNVHGCQFHPEKSEVTGLTILSNFLKL
ncbi:MAG: imidazole glycerol phosphate synthase subunit HisH [Pseudomonadota bacterium]